MLETQEKAFLYCVRGFLKWIYQCRKPGLTGQDSEVLFLHRTGTAQVTARQATSHSSNMPQPLTEGTTEMGVLSSWSIQYLPSLLRDTQKCLLQLELSGNFPTKCLSGEKGDFHKIEFLYGSQNSFQVWLILISMSPRAAVVPHGIYSISCLCPHFPLWAEFPDHLPSRTIATGLRWGILAISPEGEIIVHNGRYRPARELLAFSGKWGNETATLQLP